MTSRRNALISHYATKLILAEAAQAKKTHWKALKTYALSEVARLSKMYPGTQVVFVYVPGIASLTIGNDEKTKPELVRRFSMAEKQLGDGSYPVGIFIGVDRDVAYKPYLDKNR